MAEERCFIVVTGINLKEPGDVFDQMVWSLEQSELTEAEALKVCRRKSIPCIVWNTKKEEYVCCKNIPYTNMLNAALERIKCFPLGSKKIF